MFTIKYWVPFISSYCKPILGNKCVSTLGHRRATAVGFMVGSSFCWFQQIQTYECVKIVIPEKQGWQSEQYTPIPVYQCSTLIGCSCLVVKVVIQRFIFMLIMLLGFIRENLRKKKTKIRHSCFATGWWINIGVPRTQKKTTEMFRINLWALGSSFLTHAQF